MCLLVVLGALAPGCAGGSKPASGSSAMSGEITVFAASSLSQPFEETGLEFSRRYPGTRVRLATGSSAALATQIGEGAPADVFASANHAQMAVLVSRGAVEDPRSFATNRLVVAIQRDNAEITTFSDIARPGTRLVLGAKDVPAGQYARESIRRASNEGGYGPRFEQMALANLRSEEPHVRAVLAKVELGEADAGIVYETDLRVARSVRAVEIPPAYNVVAEYPIAVVRSSGSPGPARAFVDFVLSAEGRELLQRHGFGAPP